ncbi:MAG: LamG domain-containing protein, partial [Clostridiales Family XIII bacterium]|nr:LamG domain-containing protein [Clostridiales Family XIII bacterium]
WTDQNTDFTTYTNYFGMSTGKPYQMIWHDGERVEAFYDKEHKPLSPPNIHVGAPEHFNEYSFYIGGRYNGDTPAAHYYYQGEIASLRIYSRELTEAEIKQNAQQDLLRFG